MTKYRTFKKLITNASIENALPDIEFTDSTVQLLGTSVEHLSSSNNNAESFLNTAKNLSTAVREYESLAENMVDHYNDLKPIRDVSDAFARSLHAGIQSLSNVKKSVNKLTEDARELSNKLMVEDPVVAASLSHIEDTSIKFSHIHWESLDNLDPLSVYQRMNSTIAVDQNTDPNRTQITILLNRLPFGSAHTHVQFKNIEINKQAAKATLEHVSKAVKSKIELKDVKYVLTMLFDLDPIKCRKAVETFREVLTDPMKINSVIQLAKDFTIVIDAVNSNTLQFSKTTNEELLLRADVLKQYADMALYMSAYYRHAVWKDAIVVPGQKLNPDNWYDFRNRGGSSVGIKQHLNFYYEDKELPAIGVSSKDILEKRESLHTASKEALSQNIVEIRNKKRDILRDAFIFTATKWVNNNKKFWVNHFRHNNDVSGFVASIFDSTVDASLESSFYRVILNSCCANPLVNRLYKELSDTYTRHAEIGGELTEAQCNALDMTVYARLMTEFLLQQKIIQ